MIDNYFFSKRVIKKLWGMVRSITFAVPFEVEGKEIDKKP